MIERTLTADPKFKVKAEVRYTVDIGIFSASSQEAAIEAAEASGAYQRKVDQHRGGFYELQAQPLQTGHNPMCGCGWCK